MAKATSNAIVFSYKLEDKVSKEQAWSCQFCNSLFTKQNMLTLKGENLHKKLFKRNVHMVNRSPAAYPPWKN